MARRFSIGAAFVALMLGASGASIAQSKSKPARPAPLAMVEAVQMPAWVERGGASIPLVPGMELKDQDALKTGAGSRLLLRTADGSAIKLGERGSLFLDGMRLRGNVFEAAMKVAEGAFRFTTEVFAPFRGRRDVSIAIRSVTAGIRGTDVWGRSAPERQIVCLIEGRIDLTPPDESPISMDQPRSFYLREMGQSLPVGIALAEQLREWAGETETVTGRGVSKRGGKWKLTVASGRTHNAALDIYRDLRNTGYPAEIVPAKAGDRRVYEVQLLNFETREDAEFVAGALKQHPRLREHEYKVGT
jgi:hypothetical protein